MPSDAPYRFGRFELNPATRQLLAEGQPAELGVRAFDVLLALVERRDRLVTKSELLELVWPGLVVEENNLQVQVSTLRRLLGAQAIATIPGRGYQFTSRLEGGRGSPPQRPVRNHNLPQPLTSFIGHEADLVEQARALEETRLCTLTGIGGCGKTRFAVKLAERVLPKYPDGVWFIDLASIVDSTHVPFAVANALAIRDVPGETIEDALCDRLADRRLLLIFDNCEHVLGPCASLAQRLLQAASDVRILATSRESLGVQGERVSTVRSLRAPPASADHDLQVLAACEAVQLFVQRAELALPSFTLSAATAPAVADICRRLDGIPLAIELAAALVKVLSIDQIRSRLTHRFRLLVGGARSLSRHQTLRAVLQWSYEHLDASEQDLIRLLSVFAGGWTLDAAVAIAGTHPDAPEIVSLLRRLVDKSLVVVERRGNEEPRYRMLETVRQYMGERLDDSGQGERTRTQHLGYYLKLAAEVDGLVLLGRDPAPFVPRLDRELDNIVAAHAWCDHVEGGAALGLQLVNAVRGYWVERRFRAGLPPPDEDPLALGYRLMLEALARPGAEARTYYRCRALFGISQLSFLMDRLGEAEAQLIESTALARELGDDKILAGRLGVQAYFHRFRNDFISAKLCVDEVLLLAQRSKDKHSLAGAFLRLGELSIASGTATEAESYLNQSLALARESSPPITVAEILVELSWAITPQGDLPRAAKALREALPAIDESKDMRRGGAFLIAVVGLAVLCKAYVQAARLCGPGQVYGSGSPSSPDERARLAQSITTLRQSMESGAFDAIEAAGRQLGYQEALDEAGAWLDSISSTA